QYWLTVTSIFMCSAAPASSASSYVARTVGTAMITTRIIEIIVQIVSNIWILSTCFGINSASPFFLRKRNNTIINGITTARKTSDITIVVKIIKYKDVSALPPLGDNAVRFSLPQPASTIVSSPNKVILLNFPNQVFIYAYL